MRAFLSFLFSTCLAVVLFSQDIRVQTALDNYNFDSVTMEMQRLCGDLPVSINGQNFTITSRLYNDPGNELAFQYAKERFINYGLETDEQVFSTNGKNLFGIKTGTVFPERVCMIGAHYDNLPTGSFAPGADDNASGCSAVLEAARILSEYDFPNTIIFALWDEEELGLFGSNAYTSQPSIHGDSLLGYINLDMIGWDGNDDNVSQVHVRPIGNSLGLQKIVVDCNDLYDIGLSLEIVNPGSANTDHYSFWQKGYSAVGISEEYIGDFNPNWHSITDVLANFNLDYYDDNCRLAIASLTTLALNKSGTLEDSEVIGSAVIFPNPCNDFINVQFSQAIINPIEIELKDNLGRIVLEDHYEKIDGAKIGMQNQSAGYYTLTIRTGDFVSSFPVIKI